MLIPFIWGIILLFELHSHPAECPFQGCPPGPGVLHRQLISSFSHLFPCPSLQNGAILNKGTGRCLEVENRGMAGIDLILRSCTGQRWTIKNIIK